MNESSQHLKLLVVEDSDADAGLLIEMLRDLPDKRAKVTHVRSMREAEAHLAASAVDVIVLDIGLPDADGIGAVRRVHEAAPRVPVVVLTGLDDDSLARQSLHQGAQDYLPKNEITAPGLFRALRYAIERQRIEDALRTETERAQRSAAALAAGHELLEVTLQSIGDAVICTDESGSVTFSNAVAAALIGAPPPARIGGAPPPARIGLPADEIMRMIASCSRAPQPQAGDAAPAGARKLPENYDLITHDGTVIPIEGCIAPITGRGGEPAGRVIVFRDVSAQRAIAQQLSHRANHDALTGLPNRLLLADRIDQAITVAPRHGKKVAVLFLDLDGFKHINDTLGHLAGDLLLKSVARRLVGCVRSSDTVCRQGGDEFVVLLSEVGVAADAKLSARRVLQTVSEPHVIDGNKLHVTTSIGIGVYPDDGADAQALLKAADTAMYQAKANGRQRYQFFEPGMRVRAAERQSIEQSLHRAIDTQEFHLHYQPKINIATGLISGVEALIRWTHPERGVMQPASFIPIAEDCGLIRTIGGWVLREACAQARRWRDAGLPALKIAVNISPIEFANDNFLESILKILAETGVDPGCLEFEITEGVLMKPACDTLEVLRALKANGVSLAIDDFGTGYSSLSYLTKFPVDTIKIDQSFIRRIGAAETESTIVKAVIGMARGLNLTVVAEGVETREELDFLFAHQCDEAQGFLFSRPIPAPALAALLERQSWTGDGQLGAAVARRA